MMHFGNDMLLNRTYLCIKRSIYVTCVNALLTLNACLICTPLSMVLRVSLSMQIITTPSFIPKSVQD